MGSGWRRARVVARLLPLAIGCVTACDDGDEQPGTAAKASEQAEGKQGQTAKYGLTPEQAKKVLVKIGEREITLGDFAERLASQSPYLRARYNSPERRREFLDNMIRFELLALEARERGHDKLPEVQRVRKQIMVQRMMKQLFDEDGVKLSDITDAEVKAYYEQNKDEFHKPAQVRASHILFNNKTKAEKVLKELQAKPRDMQLFRDKAREHNQDPATKTRLGDLTFFYADPSLPDQPEVPVSVREAAFALDKTGDMHPGVIKSDAGFHVLKLTGKRAKLERSLEDAERLIRNRLWREKREAAIRAFIDKLRKDAEVEEDLTLLSQIKVGEHKGEASGAADDGTKTHASP